MKMGTLTIYLVRARKTIEGPGVDSFVDETDSGQLHDRICAGTRVTEGTYGLLLGKRTHFDLGPSFETGHFRPGILPIYQDLCKEHEIEVLGEWDGDKGQFTDKGWWCNPIFSIRENLYNQDGTPT